MEKNFQKFKDVYVEHKFLIDCIILAILFFANTFLNEFTYISFTFLFILVLTTSLNNTLSYLFFSGAFCVINARVSIVLYAVCMVVFLIRFCYQKFYIEKNRPGKKLSIALIVLLLFLLSCRFDYSIPFYKTAVLTFLVFIVLFIVYLLINFCHDFHIKINARLLSYGLVVSSVYAVFCNLVAPGVRDIGFSGTPYRFMALFTNPNTLAMVCEIVLAILGYYIVAHKYNVKDVTTFILVAGIGLFTASKTYLILLAVILICLLIFNAKHVSKQGWILISGIFVAGIVFAIIKFDSILLMVKRFILTDVSGMSSHQFLNILTTSRYDLWLGYLGYLIENPLALFLGRGLGAPKIGRLSGHNMYLNILYQMGIIGFALIITVVVFMLLDAKKKNRLKFNKAIIIPLIIIGLLCCIEDLFVFIM